MRVVYDYGMRNPAPGATPAETGRPAASGAGENTESVARRESVIVISLGRENRGPDTSSPDSANSASSANSPAYEVVLSPEARLRDGEVRHHERSHARTLGPYATTPIMYDTARGPNGEVVATGGKIGVDLDPVPGDPQATLTKARVVLNAAHAPGSPSAADMRVAAEAYRLAQEAQDAIASEHRGEHRGTSEPAAGVSSATGATSTTQDD